MLNTGSARYSVPFSLPPGTAGHAPSLALQYDSGMGSSVVAPGWSFGPSGISRSVDKGLPRYIDGPNNIDDDYDGDIDEIDEIDLITGPDGEELVSIGNGVYRARIEGSFARYRKLSDGWEVDLPGGAILVYGTTPEGRIASLDKARIFRWLLEKQIDRNGNTIDYLWKPLPGSHNQRYLSQIRWGPGPEPWEVFYFVSVTYEARPDWRKDFRSGFPVVTGHRLKRVDIGIQGITPEQCTVGDWNQDGEPDALIRSYRMQYEQVGPAVYQLSRVTRYGSDGASYLPPISFSYTSNLPGQGLSAAGRIISSNDNLLTLMDSGLADLIDLNRDALPDLLQTDYYGTAHRVRYNLGEKQSDGDRRILWSEPVDIDSPDNQATQLHLVEDRVSLGDMNGDGISDLVHTTTTNEVFYYTNQGDGSWGPQTEMSITQTVPPAPFAFENVKTADLDFNKRMDVLQSTENGYTLWLNYQNSVYSQELRTAGALSGDSVIQLSETGVDFADMNGDGLSDVAWVTPTRVVYGASMGYGSFWGGVEIMIPDIVLSDGSNSQIERAKLTDVNGDGLADLVIERAAVNELWCWLNLGTDTFSPRYIITDMVIQYTGSMAVRWADMNGNGTTDLVYADSTAAAPLRVVDIGELMHGSKPPNLLEAIDNGLGRKTTISWANSTDQYLQAAKEDEPWTSTMPFQVPVVAAVEVTTGLDLDTNPGLDRYLKTYVYRDGFYEDRERQFRGFGEVAVTEYGDQTAPGLVTISSFFTGGPDGTDNDNDGLIDEISRDNHREEEALKGKLKSVETRDDSDTLFNRSENLWGIRNLPIPNPPDREIRTALNDRSDTLLFEGTQTPETLRSTRIYDDYGNVVEEFNHGALSIDGDEVVTTTTYINDEDDWLIGLVSEQIISDDLGQTAARKRNFYDGDPFIGLALGEAERGLLTRSRQWVENSTWIDTLRNRFDSYGNVVETLDAKGSSRSITYDYVFFVYPVREDIEVADGRADLSIQAAYNIGLGVVSSSLDFNGHETRYHHDTFGRPVAIVSPGDSDELPTQTFSYSLCDPAADLLYEYDNDGVVTVGPSGCSFSRISTALREQSGQSGTLDTSEFVDGLGRGIFALGEAEENFIVTGRVLFNARGTARYRFLPYRTGAADYMDNPPFTLPHQELHYDATGRETASYSPPDENGVIDSISIIYTPLSAILIDARGNAKDSFTDGLERLISIQEHNDGEIYTAHYGYDTLGNLTSVLDNQNNLKTMTYDGLGRKTSMADPDRGSMQYWYDDTGNLIRTRDNKNQEIVYSYDRANRFLSEDFLDDADISPDVTYHYDEPDPDYPGARNLLGRLATVHDLSGVRYFSYDQRGNNEWKVTRIEDEGRRVDFRSSSEFDTMGRVRSSIFPDGDRVSYTYNRRGLLESIPGFVEDFDYHVSGGRKNVNFSNNVETTMSYDPRHRRIELTTGATEEEPLQQLHYHLDQNSNITLIDDLRTISPSEPQNATQSFMYDDLNRLTHAEGPGYGGIDFQYDSIGNLVHKASPDSGDPLHIDDPLINLQAMSYGGSAGSSSRSSRLPGDAPGPHAITSTDSGLAYTYDDNGNVETRDSDYYHWDFKDRLVRTETPHSVAEYVYDAASQRVIKRITSDGSTTTTWYIDENYEIRDGATEKYIFADTSRVARVAGRLIVPGLQNEQHIDLQPGMNLISTEMSVPVSELVSQIGSTVEVWGWNGAAQSFLGYVPAENRFEIDTLEPGRGYIVYTDQQTTLTLTGIRSIPAFSLTGGWNLVGCPADSEMSISELLNLTGGQLGSVWEYDTLTGTWRNHFTAGPEFLNNLSALQPGRAYWLQMNGARTIDFIETPVTTHFYHPDHLDSSSLVTNGSGAVAERVEYYPYGRPRFEQRTDFDSPYKYTDKELDLDTGLMYYEARYYDPGVGRFFSVDPYVCEKSADIEKLYPYEAFTNNPIIFKDFDGKQPRKNTSAQKTYKEEKELLYTSASGGLAIYRESFEGLKKTTPEQSLKESKGSEVKAEVKAGGSQKLAVEMGHTVFPASLKLEVYSSAMVEVKASAGAETKGAEAAAGADAGIVGACISYCFLYCVEGCGSAGPQLSAGAALTADQGLSANVGAAIVGGKASVKTDERTTKVAETVTRSILNDMINSMIFSGM